MFEPELQDTARSISKRFKARSPVHIFLYDDGLELAFVGLSRSDQSRLASTNVKIACSKADAFGSDVRMGLARELRTLGHKVSAGDDVPFALKKAFVQETSRGGRDEEQ